MKHLKKLVCLTLATCMAFGLSACGNNTDEPVTPPEEQMQPTEETKVTYTIKYMMNDGTDTQVKKANVKDFPSSAYITVAPTAPKREGYRFAGWQTKPDVTVEDLVNGVSPYMWNFGKNLSDAGTARLEIMSKEEQEIRQFGLRTMLIKDYADKENCLTLYARWVKETEISTAEQLQDMSKDLYGWYKLTADIDLMGREWSPIGAYFSNYEYYGTNWWTYSFRGELDGNGKTITGMSVNSADYSEKVYSFQQGAVWYNDGNTCNGAVAMFSALASASIHDFTLKDYSSNVSFSGDYCYSAAIGAFDMGSSLANINVENCDIRLTYDDQSPVYREDLFTAVAGLEAGSWSTSISNCSVTGNLELNATNVKFHGGEIYLGGMLGENYATVQQCASDTTVTLNYEDKASATQNDLLLTVNVGGLSGSSTTIRPFDADGDGEYSKEELAVKPNTFVSSVNVNVKKPVGQSIVNVGGVSGSQRYDVVRYAHVTSDIATDIQIDEVQGVQNVGAISGRFDVYYMIQILQYAEVFSAGTLNNVTNVTCNGETVTTLIEGLIDGLVTATVDGEEVQAIVAGSAAEKYDTTANVGDFESYVPTDKLNGIIIVSVQ